MRAVAVVMRVTGGREARGRELDVELPGKRVMSAPDLSPVRRRREKERRARAR